MAHRYPEATQPLNPHDGGSPPAITTAHAWRPSPSTATTRRAMTSQGTHLTWIDLYITMASGSLNLKSTHVTS
jgi:hypothetical protein